MRFHRTTGLSPHQLDVLVSRVERGIPDWDRPTGRPHALPLWKAVVVLCFLLRRNSAQVLAAELFEVSQSSVSRYGTRLRPVVRDAVRELGFGLARLPKGGRSWSTGSSPSAAIGRPLSSCSPRSTCAPGATCRSCPTPGAGCGTSAGRYPVPGARHDAFTYIASGIRTKIHKCRHRLGDKGYQGSDLLTPYKKPRRRELTDAEKASNRAHSQIRSAVERCTGHLENWKILGGCYRGPLDRFSETLDTVVQLELLRTYEPA